MQSRTAKTSMFDAGEKQTTVNHPQLMLTFSTMRGWLLYTDYRREVGKIFARGRGGVAMTSQKGRGPKTT